jgi:hypothetical protein
MQPWQATHGAAFAVSVAPLHRMTSLPRTDHFLRPGQNNLRDPFHWALHQSVLQKCPFRRDLDRPGAAVLHDAVDWPASQEKSQDCETGGSGNGGSGSNAASETIIKPYRTGTGRSRTALLIVIELYAVDRMIRGRRLS